MIFQALITNNQYVEIDFKDNYKKNTVKRYFNDPFGKEVNDSLLSLNDILGEEKTIVFLAPEDYRDDNDMSGSVKRDFNDPFGKEVNDSLLSLKDVLCPVR